MLLSQSISERLLYHIYHLSIDKKRQQKYYFKNAYGCLSKPENIKNPYYLSS